MKTYFKMKSSIYFSPAQTKSVALTEHINLSSSQVFYWAHRSLTLSHPYPKYCKSLENLSIISASTKEHNPTWFVGVSSILPTVFLFQVTKMWSITPYKGCETRPTQFVSDILRKPADHHGSAHLIQLSLSEENEPLTPPWADVPLKYRNASE